MPPRPAAPRFRSLRRGGAFAAGFLACTLAVAQLPPPPRLEQLPDAPLPPGAVDPSLEPQVTISRRDGETFEETRIGGRVVMVKVTPRVGPPYFLVDELGDGRLVRRDPSETGLRVPHWVLFQF
jgi:hypothetical protein